jgi:hypothetical protein
VWAALPRRKVWEVALRTPCSFSEVKARSASSELGPKLFCFAEWHRSITLHSSESAVAGHLLLLSSRAVHALPNNIRLR